MAFTANVTLMNDTTTDLQSVLVYHIWPAGLVAELVFAGEISAGQSAAGNPVHFATGSNDTWVAFFQPVNDGVAVGPIQVMAPTVGQLNGGDNGQTITVAIEADEVSFVIPGGNDPTAPYEPGYEQTFLYVHGSVANHEQTFTCPIKIANGLAENVTALTLYHIWPEGSLIEALAYDVNIDAGGTLTVDSANSGSGGFDWFVMFCNSVTAAGCAVTFAMSPTNSQINGQGQSITLMIEPDGEVRFLNSPNPDTSGTLTPAYQQAFLVPQSAQSKVA